MFHVVQYEFSCLVKIILTALVAISFESTKSAMVNPIDSLRSE
jgi:hypothetical protein